MGRSREKLSYFSFAETHTVDELPDGFKLDHAFRVCRRSGLRERDRSNNKAAFIGRLYNAYGCR